MNIGDWANFWGELQRKLVSGDRSSRSTIRRAINVGSRVATVESLESSLERARELDVTELAAAVESIGFDCTHCGACCRADPGCPSSTAEKTNDSKPQCEDSPEQRRGEEAEPHTATLFPDEVRSILENATATTDWRDVARPTPFGLTESADGRPTGETFEWALQTDACGDCVFFDADRSHTGGCTIHPDRPLICQTYPFSVDLAGTTQPLGEPVDDAGVVRAHECEGLGREISRADAETMARTLKARAIRELEEAIAVRDNYVPADPEPVEVVVHDSEGAKRSDGTPYDR